MKVAQEILCERPATVTVIGEAGPAARTRKYNASLGRYVITLECLNEPYNIEYITAQRPYADNKG